MLSGAVPAVSHHALVLGAGAEQLSEAGERRALDLSVWLKK
jgi:hypothetical protein